MPKKRRSYKNEIPAYETVSTYEEYWRMVEWLATPTPMREPKTQVELAKELSLHFTTLSRWQRVEGCYADIRAQMKRTLRGELPNVLYALKNKIFKDGNAKEIQLFLQWVDDFVEKQEISHTGSIDVDNPDVKKIVSDFESKLKETLSHKKT